MIIKLGGKNMEDHKYENEYEDIVSTRMDGSTERKSDHECNDQGSMKFSTLYNPLLANELYKHLCENVMVVLKANQLNILNQVFRPIMVGNLVDITNEFVVLEKVNIKMNQAPEFIFPTPLMIPLNQIAWYMPFDPAVRISLY